MSDTFHNYYNCPCGKGKIEETVDILNSTQDKTTFNYKIHCDDCVKIFDVSRKKLMSSMRKTRKCDLVRRSNDEDACVAACDGRMN